MNDKILPRQRLVGRLLVIGLLMLPVLIALSGCAPQNIGPYNETWFGKPGPRISNEIWSDYDWYKDSLHYWGTPQDEIDDYQPVPGPMASDLRPPEGDYIVGPGDLLQVTILDLFEPGQPYNVQVRVSEIGNISLPYVRSIRASGFTIQGLEERIADMLRELIREPRVTVFLVESRNRFYSVMGGVRNPNIYPLYRVDMSLLEAIAAAGGTLPFIDEWAVVIREFTPEELNAMLLEIYARRGADPMLPPEDAFAPVEPEDGAGQPLPEEMSPPAEEPEEPQASEAPAAPADNTPTELEMLQRMARGERVEAPREEPAEIPALPPGDAPMPLPGAEEPEPPVVADAPREAPAGEAGRWVFRDNVWVFEGAPEDLRTPVERPVEFREEEGLASLPADIRAELTRRGVIEGGGMLQRVIRVNVPLLRRGDVTQNVILQHNDKIDFIEPESGEFYMTGEVVRRGVYSLTGRDITVLQAVAAAGGLTQLAIPKRGMLTRRVAQDREEIIYFDLAKIADGEAPDFYLQANDLVRIGTDQGAIILAVLRNAFRATYGFGLVYDQNFADIYPWKGEIHPLF